MRWCILTGHSPEYNELGAITLPNHRAYADRHGYTVYEHYHERGNMQADAWDKTRWHKFIALITEYDGIMTIGADALFLRMDIALDDIFVFGADQQIAEENIGGCPYNNDVMLWRSCRSSLDIAYWILGGYDDWMKRPLGYQEALATRLDKKDPLVRDMKVVSAHVMNTCPWPGHPSTYREGDFIIHFFGTTLERKIACAKEWVRRVKE